MRDLFCLYVRLGVVESPVFRDAMAQAEAEPKPTTPLVQLLRNPRPLVLACAAGIGPFALTAPPLAPLLAEMFGTEMRYTGVSLGYQMAGLGCGVLGACRLVAEQIGRAARIPVCRPCTGGKGGMVVRMLR
ncbi:hypothetical protein [Nocardia fusca]|uniref:hypothetical protein n=1 Tax=Nocardia fusca TaxID=941183 RepID=UPI0007A7438C